MVLAFDHGLYEIFLMMLTILLAALCYSVVLARKSLISKEFEYASKTDSGSDIKEKVVSVVNRWAESIEDNNRLLSNMKQELKTLLLEKQLYEGSHGDDETPLLLNILLTSRIQSFDDWKSFRLTFEKVDPGFLINLETKPYNLTPTEVRIATLIRLKVPTNAMATMLNVNKKTIYKSRYRLRKKLGYTDQTVNLDEVIKNL